MTEWTYSRGRWIKTWSSNDADPGEVIARYKLQLWEYQRRWRRFPQLGPIPEKWTIFGPKPDRLTWISTALQAYYEGPIRRMVNDDNLLWRVLS